MNIGVIDYGMGNLFSVNQALKRLQCDTIVSANEEQLKDADALILPGVGAFPDAMKRLADTGLDQFIINQTKKGKPLLGICLGMQLLFEHSEEVTLTKGFGFFKGNIVKFSGKTESGKTYRVPHMGWNTLQFHFMPQWLENKTFPEDQHVYFVHSYYATNIDKKELVASADYYGNLVPGIMQKGSVTGMQFHPEKSGKLGMFLLEQWLKGVEKNPC